MIDGVLLQIEVGGGVRRQRGKKGSTSKGTAGREVKVLECWIAANRISRGFSWGSLLDLFLSSALKMGTAALSSAHPPNSKNGVWGKVRGHDALFL